jgi:hypothetical protein
VALLDDVVQVLGLPRLDGRATVGDQAGQMYAIASTERAGAQSKT